MKATGAEIWAFYQEWPPGDSWYHDDYVEPIVDDGKGETCVLDLAKKYTVEDFGVMVWQGGVGKKPEADERAAALRIGSYSESGPSASAHIPFEWWFKRWKKSETSAQVVLVCPNEKIEALRAFCAEQGIKEAK